MKLKHRTLKIAAGILAAAFFGVFAAAVSSSGVSPLTRTAGFLFSPLNMASSYISEAFGSFSGFFVSSDAYRRQVAELEEQLAEYHKLMVDYERLKQRAESYENIIEVKEAHEDFEFVPASVIGRDPAELFHSFVINKGSSAGVKINDPVIFGSYLVGVVKEVRLTTSVVLSILEPRVNISAYEVRNREDGYISNSPELALAGLCRLAGLERSTAILPGMIICTSGIGGVFPRDLIIGTVTAVKDEETDVSAYAAVKPGVDFQNLVDIFVITSFLGQGE